VKLARPKEGWTACAWGMLGLAVLLVGYLALRRPGLWPVRVYKIGPILLPALAFATGLFGVATSLRRRPFLTRPRLRAFCLLALVIVGTSYPFPFPARREGHPSAVEFSLPVSGEWTVVWGGEQGGKNLLARTRADRRFGLDLVMTVDGSSHSGDGRALEDYFAFGQLVRAPAPGRVVRVVDTFSDRVPGTQPGRERDELGNLIVIEVAPEEFFFLGGLEQGSLQVAEGATVERGQHLARVGHSAASRFTPEPHLLMHLQDTPVPRWGQAVPWFLSAYRSGERTVMRGMPSGGERIAGLEQPVPSQHGE
jgi:hypothetical protein